MLKGTLYLIIHYTYTIYTFTHTRIPYISKYTYMRNMLLRIPSPSIDRCLVKLIDYIYQFNAHEMLRLRRPLTFYVRYV